MRTDRPTSRHHTARFRSSPTSYEQRDVPAGPDVRRELVRVLVVDTDLEMRALLTGYLERHRMTVTPVADGDAMWAVLRHQVVDMLILEINLRDVDGLST